MGGEGREGSEVSVDEVSSSSLSGMGYSQTIESGSRPFVRA